MSEITRFSLEERICPTNEPEEHIFVLNNGKIVVKKSGNFLPTLLPDNQNLYFPIQDYFPKVNGFIIVGTTMGQWKRTIKTILDIPNNNKINFIDDVHDNIDKIIPHLDRIYSRISTSKHASKKWDNFCSDVVIALAYYRIWKKIHIVTFIKLPELNKFDKDGISRNMFFRM